MSKFGHVSSGVVIGRLLDCEGFTDRVSSAIRSWMRRNNSEHVNRSMAKRRAAFEEMMDRVQMSHGDKLILGRFIASEVKSHFSAGVRLGLAANFCGTNGSDADEPIERMDNP